MNRKARTVNRLTDDEFQAALCQIRSGRIPENFYEIAKHTNGTVKELSEFAVAITECALRQNTTICVLQDILEKADVRYQKTPDGPVKIINRQEDTYHAV